MNNAKDTPFDVAIVGGAGHVGLPLGLVFADKGLNVCLYDINQQVIGKIKQGKMPFIEYGAETILPKVLNKTLHLTSEIESISHAKTIIIAVGTPVDEFLNPQLRIFLELFQSFKPHLNPEQTIIIRSTVYPRTCLQVKNFLEKDGNHWHIAYCPERVAQGYAVRELRELPQLVSGYSPEAIQEASDLFGMIAKKIITISVEEAELAKLFTNAWRYIQFGVANQFYLIANDFGVDFNKIREAMVEGYGRAANLASAGFAAGPCLLKDTMQLAAFQNNRFMLGHAAMMVNEGMPNAIVENLRKNYDLNQKKIGILGMAFKANIDDNRNSLSYKLGKLLRFQGADIYYSDEYIKDPTFVSKEDLIENSEIIIIGVPHDAYKKITFPDQTHVVDLWGI